MGRQTRGAPTPAPAPKSEDVLKTESSEVLYHCNVCQRDLTHEKKYRCTVCSDFDLCSTCFNSGQFVSPHLPEHQCKEFERMDFPLFTVDWSAEEELGLLEAIEQMGLGNWEAVSEQVGTKTAEACKAHYISIYLESPTAPLPDSQKILPPGTSLVINPPIREEQIVPFNIDNCPKPIFSTEENAASFNPLRSEFEIEWENEAELALKDISFNPDDSEADKEIKHKALEALMWIQRERVRRRDLILEKKLLEYKKLQVRDRKKFTDICGREVSPIRIKQVCKQLRAFASVATLQEYEDLLDIISREMSILQNIESFKEMRSLGIHTILEYEEYKIEKAHKNQDWATNSTSTSTLPSTSLLLPGGVGSGISNRSPKKLKTEGRNSKVFSVAIMRSVSLLTLSERKLCEDLHISPQQYFAMKEAMIRKSEFYGGISPSKARKITKLEPAKVNALLEYLAQWKLIRIFPSTPIDTSGAEEKHHNSKHHHDKSGDKHNNHHKHHTTSFSPMDTTQ